MFEHSAPILYPSFLPPQFRRLAPPSVRWFVLVLNNPSMHMRRRRVVVFVISGRLPFFRPDSLLTQRSLYPFPSCTFQCSN
ncbi:hypothetical protein M405DRAFT_576822 [Rhizopogon salebrosus TDB-379]|nr:hypothetical protein M405DRAFT_576822 [Rhizopogon salebrosus TDB-379]